MIVYDAPLNAVGGLKQDFDTLDLLSRSDTERNATNTVEKTDLGILTTYHLGPYARHFLPVLRCER